MEGKGKGDGRRDGPLRLSTCATGRTRSTAQVDFRPDRATASRSMAHGRFLSAVAVAPAVARLKGMAETLDLVDFGVAVGDGDRLLRSQRIKDSARLAIQRSDIKTDGGRKRWHCNKVAATRPATAASRLGAESPTLSRQASRGAETTSYDSAGWTAKRSR